MAKPAFKVRRERVFFYLFSFLIFFFTFQGILPQAGSQSLEPTVLVEAREKLNLIGFVPPEKRPSYVLETVAHPGVIIESLLEEKALLGFLSPIDFLKARASNVPLIALASPLQYTPVAFAYKKNVFLRSFEDFKGRTVLYEPGTLGEVLFRHFLRQINIAPSELLWVPLNPGEEKGFEKADIVILDKISEAVQFNKNPELDQILYPHDFGINFKGPLLVTTETLLKKYPEAVKSLANEALAIFQFNIFDERSIYTVLLQRTLPYVFQVEEPFGTITEKDWWQMERLLLEEGVLTQPVPEQEIFSPVLFPSRAKKPDVVIALPGLPSADFSGFYAAEDKGYYERGRESIELAHLSGESAVIESVRSGEALIGVASPFGLLKAQAEKPDLKVIGVIYQIDPTVLLGLADPSGKGKFSLVKKTIWTDESGSGAVLSLIRETPVKKNDLELTTGYPSVFALLDKRTDFVTGRNVFEDPRLERYRDFLKGVTDEKKGVVGLSIFTTQRAYDQNRELIKNLLKSTFHGFENSVFQTENTAESIISRDPSLSLKDLKHVLKDNSLFIKDSHGIIGSINPAAWQELSNLALTKGFLESAPNLDQFFPEEAKRTQES